MSAYPGSQAFAQRGSGVTELVVRNSGSLVFSQKIISLQGILSSINLDLTLTYSVRTPGYLGLPTNWGFEISYLIPNQSLTYHGKTYIINPNWSDSTGYQSGLQYLNNWGISLQFVGPTPLPNDEGEYSWKLKTTEGSLYFYDELGRLVLHQDVYGNGISYYYVDMNGPSTTMLERIKDSWGNIVIFTYDFGVITITAPDQTPAKSPQSTVITFDHAGVVSIVDPMQQLTTFDNQIVAGTSDFAISGIVYPTGLHSSFDYMTFEYLDSNHSNGYIPAVQEVRHNDSNSKLLNRLVYIYGELNGNNNFTGSNFGYTMGTDGDGLMDSGDTTFLYDVCTKNFDANGNVLAMSRTTYTYLHVPLTEEKYLVDVRGDYSESLLVEYTYDIDPDMHARTPNYNVPVTTIQSHSNKITNVITPYRRSNAAYDNYGALTSEQSYIWNVETNAYDLQVTNLREYAVREDLCIELTTLEYTIDGITGEERKVKHTYDDGYTEILSTDVTFKPVNGDGFLPWKTKSFTYDGFGRTLTETLAWSDGVEYPSETVGSSTTTNTYSYDGGILSLTVTDALGHSSTTKRDMRIARGPVVETTIPIGPADYTFYDSIGRLTKYIDRLGNARTVEYNISASGNQICSIDPMGYILRKSYDALGRIIKVEDNSDPTSPSPIPNRTLSTVEYDELGRQIKQTDILGLATTYDSYDAYDRPLQSTDPMGNVTTWEYNDASQSTKTSINDDLREVMVQDSFGHVLSHQKHPDSDSSINYFILTHNTYNGYGKSIQTTLSQISSKAAVQLSTTTQSYDPEYSITNESTASLPLGLESPSGYDTLERSSVFDLFGNKYTTNKIVTYQGGKPFEHPGAIRIFDAANHLVTYRNQLKQEENYEYDANSRLTTLTRFDKSTTGYTYYDNGQLETVTDSDGSSKFTYYANERVNTVSKGTDTITYTYTLAGDALTCNAGDKLVQAYTLDAAGRVSVETDAAGVTRHNYFNNLGQVSSIVCGEDTVTYTYKTANHTNGTLYSEATTGGKDFSRVFTIDGFYRTSNIAVTDADSNNLLNTTILYNARDRLQQSISSSSLSPESNYTRDVAYDGLDQMVSDVYSLASQASNETILTYDGNSNVLSVAINGVATNYTYNAIDQHTGDGFMYDVNGRMTQDGKGRKYQYTADDKLSAVDSGTGGSGFTYRSDHSVATYTTPDSAATLYYNANNINAMKVETSGNTEWTSFVHEQKRRLAGYDSSGGNTYFLQSEGSTAMLLQSVDTALGYSSYGSVQSGSSVRIQDRFLWKQELTDPSHGLVYLRSRFYSSDSLSFLTMDSTDKENRYSYCNGDPLNLEDPSGHDVGATAAGMAVSLTIGVLGAVAAAFIPETLPIAVAILANMGAAVASGVVSGVAGDLTTHAIEHTHMEAKDWIGDVVTGAVGGLFDGALTGGVPKLLAKVDTAGQGIAARIAKQMEKRLVRAVFLNGASAAFSSVVGSASQQPISTSGLLINAAADFGFGSIPDVNTEKIKSAAGRARTAVAELQDKIGQSIRDKFRRRAGPPNERTSLLNSNASAKVKPQEAITGHVEGSSNSSTGRTMKRLNIFISNFTRRLTAKTTAPNSTAIPVASPPVKPESLVSVSQGQEIGQTWNNHVFASYSLSIPFELLENPVSH
ncbi:hypothetical protein TWF281_002502 [Arthrobotrys megalospora]